MILLNKSFVLFSTALCLLGLLSGCGNKSVPDFSLPPSDVTIVDPSSPTGNSSYTEDSSTTLPDNRTNLEDVAAENMSSDIVKSWFSDETISDFSPVADSDPNFYSESAPLRFGGSVTVSEYTGSYYNSIYTCELTDDEGVLYDLSCRFLHLYMLRGLTPDEQESLRTSIHTALQSDDVVFVNTDSSYVYLTVTDSFFSLVIY